MKKIGFSQRLAIALDRDGFPPKNKGRIQLLAEMMGLTHRGASKWINGETCPPAKKYSDLAQKLNVNELWLRDGLGIIADEQNKKPVALISKTSLPLYALSNVDDANRAPIETVNTDLPIKESGFAIRLESEAMSPRFPSGSLIIFDRDKKSKDGDFILVKTSYYPLPVFRQLLQFDTSSYLNAHNPKFDRLNLMETDKILGTMVQAIISFI